MPEITRQEFHEMENRIVGAVNASAVDLAGTVVQVENNRVQSENNRVAIIRLGTLSTALTAIGSSIAGWFGSNN